MQTTGIVEVVSEKHESNAGKPFRTPLYSVKMNDEQWYGCGFKNPNVQQGDNITFLFETDGQYKNMDVGTIVKAATSAGSGTKARAVSPDQRQQSIVYQSSRKDAINLLTIAVNHDLVKLPKASAYDTLLGLVDDLTLDFARKAIAPDLEADPEPAVEVVTDE